MAGPLTPGRRTLLTFGVPLSLAFIGYGALGIVNAIGLTHYTETVNLVSTARALTVNGNDGSVHLVVSPDAGVHVVAKGVYSLSKPRLVTATSVNGVTISGHQCSGGVLICSQDITIEVPASFQVTARSEGGDVKATGLTGALNLQSSAGDVKVTRASGQLVLSSSAGDVEATDISSTDVSATSSAGDVDLRFDTPPDRVVATSSAGDVDVQVPNTVAYRVSSADSNGSGAVKVHTDSQSARTIEAHTSAGDVRVEPSS